MTTEEAKHELREQIEICDGCKSGAHGCEQFFCMCDCRHPAPWREGDTPAYSTIEDANGNTLLYDVISNKRPSEIRARVLRAVNNHDALVEALRLVVIRYDLARKIHWRQLGLPRSLDDDNDTIRTARAALADAQCPVCNGPMHETASFED